MKVFKKHKYNAVRTQTDGIKFDSKKEAAYYEKLKLLQCSGELMFFLRQVPFDLPGGIKYRIDFIEFYVDGNIEFVDVKGKDTDMSRLKRKQVENLYPIKIILK